jgi:hypothetical protein
MCVNTIDILTVKENFKKWRFVIILMLEPSSLYHILDIMGPRRGGVGSGRGVGGGG